VNDTISETPRRRRGFVAETILVVVKVSVALRLVSDPLIPSERETPELEMVLEQGH